MTSTTETTRNAQSGSDPAPGVTPYLMVDGAAKAIDFYKRAFAAGEIGERSLMEDGRIMNVRLAVNGGEVMLMDPMPEHGHPATAHDGFNLHLTVDDADRWIARAAEAGAAVSMPAQDMFWGHRYGMVKDPFGITWGIGSPLANR